MDDNDKLLEKKSLNELANDFAREAHDRLLLEGGKGLSTAMFSGMQTALYWKKLKDEKQKRENPIPAITCGGRCWEDDKHTCPVGEYIRKFCRSKKCTIENVNMMNAIISHFS
jgi:hypothetical protein